MNTEDSNVTDEYDGYEEKPDNEKNDLLHEGSFSCPSCGSKNTGQSTYADYCNCCGWFTSY